MRRFCLGLFVLLSLCAASAPAEPVSGVSLRVYAVEPAPSQVPLLADDAVPIFHRVAPTIAFEGAADFGGLAESFVALVDAVLTPPRDGWYTLRLVSDDGSLLYLDDTLVLDHDGLHAAAPKDARLYLEARPYRLHIPFFERGGDEVLRLEWQTPGSDAFVVVPTEALSTHQTAVPTGAGPNATRPRVKSAAGVPLSGLHPGYRLEEVTPEGFDLRADSVARGAFGRLRVTGTDAAGERRAAWLSPGAGSLTPAAAPPTPRRDEASGGREVVAYWPGAGIDSRQPAAFARGGRYPGQVIFSNAPRPGLWRVQYETIDGRRQGTVFPFSAGLPSAVGGLAGDGHGGYALAGAAGAPGQRPFGVYELHPSGEPVFELEAVERRANGLVLRFTEPLSDGAGWDSGAFQVTGADYRAAEPLALGEGEALSVTSATVSDDGRSVFLALGDLRPQRLYHVGVSPALRSAEGRELWAREAWVAVRDLPERHGVAAAAPEGALPNTLTAAEREAGWTLLFDGQNPAEHWRGFRREEFPAGWRAEGGTLLHPAGAGGGDIISREAYENFELKLEFRMPRGANSGLMYRVTEEVSPSWHSGPEIQLLGEPAPGESSKHSVGSLYDMKGPEGKRLNPPGQWNAFRLVVSGDRVEHWVNGDKVLEYTIGGPEWREWLANSKFRDLPRFATERRGHLVLQDHGDEVAFRNLMIRELPAGRQASAGAAMGPVAQAQALPDPPELPLQVLLYTQTLGFRHGSIEAAKRVLKDLADQTRLFEVTLSEDPADLSAERLRNVDVVAFYTTGEIPLDIGALTGWVRSGGGFLGLHSATDTLYKTPEYGKLVGGYFDQHPWHQNVGVIVEDREHPATAHLPERFEVVDEIYQHRDWSRDNLRVLMRLDPDSVDLTKPNVHRTDRDFGLAWTREEGQGRVLMSVLGHRDEVWDAPWFQQHLVGAVKWLGRLDWRSDPEIQALLQRGDAAGLAELVETRPEALRSEPVEALRALGGAKAAEALTVLTAPEQLRDVRVAALRALGRLPDSDLATLTAALDDPSTLIRVTAVRALGDKGGAEAEQRLIALLDSDSERLQAAALEALAGLGTPAARAALLQVLAGGAEPLQRRALEALGSAQEDEVVDAYLALMASPGSPLAAAVAEKLLPRAADERVQQAFRAALASDNQALRRVAVRGVAASGREGLADLLVPLMFDDDTGVAAAATEAAGALPGFDASRYLTPYIADWLVLGPFANPGGSSAHNKDFGPEADLDLDARLETLTGPAGWQPAEAKGGLLNFREVWPQNNQNTVAYATTTLVSPSARTCQLRLGSDDGAKVWVNGKLVLDRNVPRGLTRDQDRVPIELDAGPNRLLVKVMQGGGDWSLAVRLGCREGDAGEVRFEVGR